MNQPPTSSARGMSKGMFLAMFLIPCVLTYIVGGAGLLIGAVTAGVGWFLLRVVLAVLYIWMAAASWSRGAANGSRWAVVLPLAAGVFDVFIFFVPFVPTVFNIVALVVGVRKSSVAGGSVNATTGLGMLLGTVLVLQLSGCGPRAGDEYIGEWTSLEGRGGMTLEITRHGESTFAVEFDRMRTSAVATLNDDGVLVVQVRGSNVPLIVDEVSGRLTFDRDEYTRFGRLIVAAREGDVALIKTLLEAGADVDVKTSDGETALILAVSPEVWGETDEAVKALLEAGADVDARDSDGVTALILAVWRETDEAVKALLEAGADVDAKTPDGETALMVAARGTIRVDGMEVRIGGGAETVDALLEAGADVDAKTPDGATALMFAAAGGDAETVDALLEAGADVDATMSDGSTALMFGAFGGDADTVDALLEAGADVDATMSDGSTALMSGAFGGDADTVDALLEAGADVDAKTSGGLTALVLAAAGRGDADAVGALLEAGADVDAKTSGGLTALVVAAAGGRDADAVGALLEVGAGADAKGSEGHLAAGATALMAAAAKGDADAVRALLGAGVDVDAKGPGEETALAMAARNGHTDAVRALLGPLPFRDCPECPEMTVIPAGSYRMGSGQRWERPMHEVAFVAPFALGVYEVTVSEFGRFVDETGYQAGSSCQVEEGGDWKERDGLGWRDPGFGQSGRHPVACVDWNDAQAYVAWLSQHTGAAYRLPSESEWEYAARAGTTTARYWGEGESGQCQYANGADATTAFSRKARCNDGHAQTAAVGSFGANGWGLHDMLGNVWETTGDCWNGGYAGAPADGAARESGDCTRRVLRGGSWNYGPSTLRAATRSWDDAGIRYYNVGFRVARTLAP